MIKGRFYRNLEIIKDKKTVSVYRFLVNVVAFFMFTILLFNCVSAYLVITVDRPPTYATMLNGNVVMVKSYVMSDADVPIILREEAERYLRS